MMKQFVITEINFKLIMKNVPSIEFESQKRLNTEKLGDHDQLSKLTHGFQ